jgi:hypothetical protein
METMAKKTSMPARTTQRRSSTRNSIAAKVASFINSPKMDIRF